MNEQATIMNPQQQQQQQQQMMNMNQNQMMSMSQMNQPQQQMVPMNRSYGMWAPPMQPQPQFQNPNQNPLPGMKQSFPFGKSSKPLGPRNNWKGKNIKNDKRRMEQQKSLMAGSSSGAPGGGVNISGNLKFNNYNPPTVNELQHQNRLKTRKFFSKKKFNKNNSMNMNMGNNNKNNNRSAPFAPRNTSSYIIRAKKSGGIASLVSPCPVTPAVLPTPIFSPSREVFVDMAKEEWGVDGYGSMKGFIRLRSPGHELDAHEDDEEDDGGSSESDVEEHVEVERRLDHDLSRFEMIYNPNGTNVGGMDFHNVLENRVDDQDTHIAQLEEENLILKERLFLMEREFADLRRRLQGLERRRGHGEGDYTNEEVVENESENESVSRGEETHLTEENNEDLGEENVVGDEDFNGKNEDDRGTVGVEATGMNNQNVLLDIEVKVENENDGFVEADNSEENIVNADRKEDKNGDEFAEASKTEENIVTLEEKEGKDIEKNKHVDGEVKSENNIIVEASERKIVGADVCMEEVGHAEDKAISEKCLEN